MLALCTHTYKYACNKLIKRRLWTWAVGDKGRDFKGEMGGENYIIIFQFKNRKKFKRIKYMEVNGSVKLEQPLWNWCGSFSPKLKTELPYFSFTSFEHTPNGLHRDTWSAMWIVALFTVARKWYQPWRQLTDGRIMKMYSISTVELDSTIKKNKNLPENRWNWECINCNNPIFGKTDTTSSTLYEDPGF